MLASLLVSVLMVSFKLNSAKEIVQTIERRQELKVNLSMVRRQLEIEDHCPSLSSTTSATPLGGL